MPGSGICRFWTTHTLVLQQTVSTLAQPSFEKQLLIAIAHRLSTIARMDRIIVMDEGRIVEQGSHAELTALSGIYANFWTHQSEGFINTDA